MWQLRTGGNLSPDGQGDGKIYAAAAGLVLGHASHIPPPGDSGITIPWNVSW